jgi:histidyl-tRNA synthetase
MSQNRLQAVRGMNDILPEQSAQWLALEHTLRQWLRAYGYREIRTPLLEFTPLFTRSIGEVTDIVEKEMYSFVDEANGESLTLRPEATASCVRMVVEHNLLYNGPQRLSYLGPMFRHERPQKGRYRQFHQCGAEAFGYAGPDLDAEMILMTARLWKQLGLREVTLELNTIGSAAARQNHRSKLVAFFRQHFDALDEDCRRRLESNPLRILDSKNPALQELIAAAPRLMDELDEESLRHFEELQQLLSAAGQPWVLNHRLVRGLDYYNATVFEWTTPLLGAQSTICGGGRYDSLVEQLGGKPSPAIGFAMGMERLLALMEASGSATDAQHWQPELYIIHQGEGALSAALILGEQLRDQGLRVITHGGGGNFKNQMKRADASGAAYAALLGEEELRQGRVALKPLRGQGEQQLLSLAELIEHLKTRTS